MNRTLSLFAISACLVAGCYESPTEVTNYEPGVYKGKQDPFLQKQDAKRNEELIERFNMVQTDR
ncbi:MAG: hypothetical protein ACREVE_07695 [Gammaproteobacteria bacterium]